MDSNVTPTLLQPSTALPPPWLEATPAQSWSPVPTSWMVSLGEALVPLVLVAGTLGPPQLLHLLVDLPVPTPAVLPLHP